MPKQSPIPDDLDRPYFDACNEGRLVLQYCERCERFQHPPEPTCASCESDAQLGWREIAGNGRIYSYSVIYDTPIALMQPDQPFNVAVIELDEAPGCNVLSHLPGTEPGRVPVGARVELIFEKTAATGQMVPEWKVADS